MEVYEILHDQHNFYIACELCKGGELYKWMLTTKVLSETNAAKVIKQVL